jgi:hypothetical protein
MRKSKLTSLLVLLAVMFGVTNLANAQDEKKPTIELYGFIRVDAYMDTYKGQDLGHDIFYLLPQYAKVGDIEINNTPSANISAIASRLGARINGPDVFNAKLTALMEFDFAGNLRTDPTMFRIRQAYSQLTWEKSSLLMGQAWHPFFGGTNMPVVAGLNTGAPFHAFNRSPLIRYNQKIGGLTLSLSAVSEMQYSTKSVDDYIIQKYPFIVRNTPNQAKRNGILPEMVVTADWVIDGKLFAGAGAQYKIIKPRMLLENANGDFFKADETLSSTGFVGYLRYKGSKMNIMGKGFYGQNMSHLVMPGGYGIASYDVATGKETYTNYTNYTVLLSAVYGTEFQVGLFAAYGQNLGTDKKLYDKSNYGNGNDKNTFGLFETVQDMMRVAPHIAYNKGKLRFVAEFETTIANYGQGAINLDNGLYNSVASATNNRVIFTMTHYF